MSRHDHVVGQNFKRLDRSAYPHRVESAINPHSETASFDLVLVSLVLEHLEDPAPSVRSRAASSKMGGTLIVIELHPIAYAAGSRARFEDKKGTKHTAAWPHTAEVLRGYAIAAVFSPTDMKDVSPSAQLLERFPSRRAAGTPWLLEGAWVRP